MVALSALWVAPHSLRSTAEGAFARVASAARGVATGEEPRHAWRALRGVFASRPGPVEAAAGTGVAVEGATPNAASPTTDPLLLEESAASARIAEATRLVERSNAAAASNHAAGAP
jgi:hypothetical protein